jgi:hypothetical protein
MEVRQKTLTTLHIILSGTKISKFKNNQKPYFWVFFSTKHRKVTHFGKGKVKNVILIYSEDLRLTLTKESIWGIKSFQ